MDNLQSEEEKNQVNSIVLTTQQQRTILDDKVRKYILKGHSRAQTIKYILKESEKLGHEHTESHASNIYNQVRVELKRDIEEIKEDLQNDIVSKIYDLYIKNYDKEDYKECRELLNSIAKICGLNNNSVNIAKNDKGDEIININFS